MRVSCLRCTVVMLFLPIALAASVAFGQEPSRPADVDANDLLATSSPLEPPSIRQACGDPYPLGQQLPNCSECDRWYISLSGGPAPRSTVHETTDSRTFIKFDTGFAANVALGYRFDRFRLETEYSFMNNECSEAGAGGLSTPTTGNVNLRALMFNAYRDFQFQDWFWKPYVGGGLGLYQSEINSLYPDFFNTLGAPFTGTPVNTTSDTPLAYQFRVGASRPLGQRAEFFGGYRYFRGETLTFAAAPFASFSPTFTPDGADMHNVELGLRIRF